MAGLNDSEEALFQQVLKQFYADNLVEAFTLLQTLGNFHTEAQLTPEKLQTLQLVEEVEVLKFEIQETNRALGMLADFSTWTPRGENEHAATFSMSMANKFYVRSEVIIQEGIFPVVAVLSESDLLGTWIELINKSEEIGQPSCFRKILHFQMNLPWPCKNRDLLLGVTGVPIPQNQSILLVIRDLAGRKSYLGVPLPPLAPDYISMTFDFSCCNIMRRTESETQLSIIFQGDPHMPFIPEAIMNYSTSKVMLAFISSVRRECLKFRGSQYERRVEEKREYYAAIQERATRFNVEI